MATVLENILSISFNGGTAGSGALFVITVHLA